MDGCVAWLLGLGVKRFLVQGFVSTNVMLTLLDPK